MGTGKMAGFIKFTIPGQIGLWHHTKNFSPVKSHSAIVHAVFNKERNSDCDKHIPSVCPSNEIIEAFERGIKQFLRMKKVATGISCYSKLGTERVVCALFIYFFKAIKMRVGVCLGIANDNSRNHHCHSDKTMVSYIKKLFRFYCLHFFLSLGVNDSGKFSDFI